MVRALALFPVHVLAGTPPSPPVAGWDNNAAGQAVEPGDAASGVVAYAEQVTVPVGLDTMVAIAGGK